MCKFNTAMTKSKSKSVSCTIPLPFMRHDDEIKTFPLSVNRGLTVTKFVKVLDQILTLFYLSFILVNG